MVKTVLAIGYTYTLSPKVFVLLNHTKHVINAITESSFCV